MNAENNSNNKKVVFLTKKQREQLRLEKLKEEQQGKIKYIKSCDQSKRMYEEIGEIGEIKDKNSQTTAPKVQKKPKKIKKENSEEGEDSRSRSRSKSQQQKKKQKKTKKPIPLTREQIEKIQQQEKNKMKLGYLGLIKVKRKQIKQLQKFKTVFNFQWADNEDTTQLASSINVNRVEPKLMFGRGLVAGIDIVEQKKENGQQIFSKIDKSMQHWTQKKSSQMTQRDWRIFREDNDIITKGGKIPNPIRDWSDANIEINILDAIRRFGFQKPKPIQMQAIPIGLIKKDLIALAPTGEGKTLAYLIPLISFLQKLPPQTPQNASAGPYSIILVPSRELAEQIQAEFQKMTVGLGMRCFTVVGGKNLESQGLSMQRGCELLLGTPGRIKDLLQKRYFVLQQCSWVVLDQADKMIDFAMQPDVNYILDSIGTQYKSEVQQIAELQQKSADIYQRKYRVTHLFSATMPAAIEKLAKKYLRSYCHISIGEPGSGKKEIQQHVQLIQESQKKQSLGRILKQLMQPIIIFVNQKRSCEILAKILQKWGWLTVDYHGGKSQEQRQAAVQGFKLGKYHILIATDLASRGLHVEGVTAVINFDAPKSINDYIHRIGRTGRAGKKGLAYTFLTPGDESLFYDLKDFLAKNQQEIPSELDNHPASKIKPGSITENIPRRKQILYAQ